ncbi:MAG: HAD hydrolase family protein, partial [Clostridia bacterium]|nr:HAD hydrolase family protein [Clostridia bacterium]
NRKLLDELQKKYKVIMVGAGNAPRIYAQMGEYPIDMIANYGMQESKMINGKFTIVKELKTSPDKAYFQEKAEYLRKKYGYTDYKGETLEFHSTGMVTFPLLGTKAEIADKIAFDPTRERRKVLYPEVVELFPDYTVYIGGSSSFDFTEKRYNKYDAIMEYAQKNGYKKEEILYIGDDFSDGGGDSHIRIFGMDYVQIDDYAETAEKLKFLLGEK